MDSFLATQLQIPTSQALFLLSFSTLALVIGSVKLALLMNYSFVIYWVYIAPIDLFNHEKFYNLTDATLVIYGFGLVIVLLALLCIFFSEA